MSTRSVPSRRSCTPRSRGGSPSGRWPGDRPSDRWAKAERAAFGERVIHAEDDRLAALLARLQAEIEPDADLGPDQLVHGDLAGNVLLDADGAPVVIDVAPYWRPALWAEATAVLDSILWWGAEPGVMTEWVDGALRQAMLRSAVFRLLSDRPADVERYESALWRRSPQRCAAVTRSTSRKTASSGATSTRSPVAPVADLDHAAWRDRGRPPGCREPRGSRRRRT